MRSLLLLIMTGIAAGLTGCAFIGGAKSAPPATFAAVSIPGCPSPKTGDKAHPDNLDGLPEVGAGPHGFFEVLRDPATGKPLGNTPYFMQVNHTGFGGKCEQLAFFEITDALGRSAFLLTKKAVSPSDVVLVRRVGEGKWGGIFRLAYDPGKRTEQAAPHTEYRITACDGKTFQGISDAQGETVYFSHPDEQCELRVRIIRHDSE